MTCQSVGLQIHLRGPCAAIVDLDWPNSVNKLGRQAHRSPVVEPPTVIYLLGPLLENLPPARKSSSASTQFLPSRHAVLELCLFPSILPLDVANPKHAGKASLREADGEAKSWGHESAAMQGSYGGQRPILATTQPSQSRLPACFTN